MEPSPPNNFPPLTTVESAATALVGIVEMAAIAIRKMKTMLDEAAEDEATTPDQLIRMAHNIKTFDTIFRLLSEEVTTPERCKQFESALQEDREESPEPFKVLFDVAQAWNYCLYQIYTTPCDNPVKTKKHIAEILRMLEKRSQDDVYRTIGKSHT